MSKLAHHQLTNILLLFNYFVLIRSINNDDLCNIITDSTKVSLKGIRSFQNLIGPAISNRADLVVSLNDTSYFHVPIELKIYKDLVRVLDEPIVPVDQADAAYSYNISGQTQHAVFYGMSVKIQTGFKEEAFQIKDKQLKNYNHPFTSVQAAAHLPPFTVLVVKNDETFTQVIIKNESKIESIVDFNEEKPPTMTAFLSKLSNTQYNVLACFANGEKIRDTCGIYQFEITPTQALFTFDKDIYHANIKRTIGCSLTESEFCKDPRIDATYAQYFVQGRHTYLLNEQKFTHFKKDLYKDAVYQCPNSPECFISSEKIYCGGNYIGSLKQVFNLVNETVIDAAYCGSNSEVNLVYDKKIFNYNRSSSQSLEEIFPGVPPHPDAILVNETTSQFIFFKLDKYYTSHIYEQATINTITQSISACSKPVTRGVDRRRILIIVTISIIALLAIIALIIGITRSKSLTSTSSNRTADPNTTSTISDKTSSVTV